MAERDQWPADAEHYCSDKQTLEAVLEDAASQFPQRALLLFCTDYQLPDALLQRLQWWRENSQADALTCCSNSASAFNPFGFTHVLPEPPATADLDALVANTSRRPLLKAPLWPQHLLWLSDQAMHILRRQTQPLQRPEPLACGLRMLIADDIFCRDTKCSLFDARPDYGWDIPPAQAIDYRLTTLQSMLQQQCLQVPRLRQEAAGMTLHISHSWGGGIQHWVDNYCEVDQQHQQLILKSAGFWKHKTYGSRFSLHQGSSDGPELQNWYLVPAIGSTSIRHPQYQQMLDEICQRYRVQRIIVSSLIGHSLDALRRSMPTVAVIHDFYPAWPLLSQPPGNEPAAASLQQQLSQLRSAPRNVSGDDLLLFNDRDAQGWQSLTRAWQHLLQQDHIAVVAPSHAAVQQLLQLVPDLAASERMRMQIIEHGFSGWPQHTHDQQVVITSGTSQAAESSVDKHGQAKADQHDRLRLVLPGRLVTGKGLELLLAAWPLIRDHVHLTLLGCGRSGRCLLGQANIDVIMDYAWQDLPTLMHDIKPDAALLLSTVTETYSYTLSELFALNVPVIATRRGSFVERIKDQTNGLLIEPDPAALQRAVLELQQQPPLLTKIQQGAKSTASVSLDDMLQAYAAIWSRLLERSHDNKMHATISPKPLDLPTAGNIHLQQMVSWQTDELNRQQQILSDNKEELRDRAAALHRQRQTLQQLRDKQQTAQAQIRQLHQQSQRQQLQNRQFEQQLNQQQLHNRQLAQQLSQQQLQNRQSAQQLSQQKLHIEDLERQRAQVLASRSWRLTMPFRVLNRLASNFRRQRAWNPLLWPRLVRSFSKLCLSNGLTSGLQQMQGHAQAHNPVQPVSRVADVKPDADADRFMPVHWQMAETDAASSMNVLIVIPADIDDSQAKYLLPMLHQLKSALYDRAAQVHIVAANAHALLSNCEGLHHHAELNTAIEALSATANNCSHLLIINNLLQLQADTLSQLLFAAEHNHAMVVARPVPEDSEQTLTGPVNPQQAVSRQVLAFCPDLLLLSEPARSAFLRYCSHLSNHPRCIDASLLALAEKRRSSTAEGIWQQSLSVYRHYCNKPREHLHLNSSQPADAAGCMLVVDVWVPMPDKDSGSLRMVNMLKLLVAMGWRVVFVPMNLGHAGQYTEQLQQEGIEIWYQPFIGSWKQFLQQYGTQFNIVMLSRLKVASEMMRRIRRYCADASIIYDTVDLHYLREQRQAELQNGLALRRLAEQTRHQELNLMQQADMTLVVSAAEQSLLLQELPDIDVRIVTNIHEVAGCQAAFEDRSGVLFIGGFQHPPNIDAAVWLAEEIWPQVTAQLPQVKLHLIGSNATEKVHALASDNIIVHGFVEQLEPWLDAVRCTVAPLRYGAGVKGKINSSMGRGVPVVATSIGAEGMFLEHGRDVLLADDSTAFAAAIVNLHEDSSLWHKLSSNAVSNVEQHFSMARAKQDLHDILQALQQPAEQTAR